MAENATIKPEFGRCGISTFQVFTNFTVSELVGKLPNPRAIKHVRRSGDVTKILNGRPSRAVIRAIVDWRVFSLRMYLFIGPTMRELCTAAAVAASDD